MDVGTGKPTADERHRVAHHLIDLLDPDESFDAARYQKEADRAIEDIFARGKTALVEGGTGLYVKTLLHGVFEDPEADRIETWEEKLSYYKCLGEYPHKILEEMDPESAQGIHPNDRVRAQRALEVLLRTGQSITALQNRHGFLEDRYQALVIGLTMERDGLFERINARVDEMLRRGLLEEVRSLMHRYPADLPSMRGLGYRHMVKVIRGEWGMSEAVHLQKRDTRRYAKRQLTWFHHQEKVEWFSAPFCVEGILETIRAFFRVM
jgi:tRNA dimethylallyltransferase